MKNFPKISIITPSYNQGKYIEQTIKSVIDQNYPQLEYIIIDGGSTDNTIETIKKYERHITYWISEPDNGQTDAINKGFAKCTGEIFNWINGDDYYEPGALIKLGSLFLKHPSAEVICGKEWYFDDISPEEKKLNQGSIIKKDIFQTIREGIIDQPCTFFRTKCINDFFPLDNSLRYVMDRQLWLSYLLKYGQGNILQTDEVLTNFRWHQQSKSIGEAGLFESESDRLKFSLFRQLQAPEILEQQLPKNDKRLKIKWQVHIRPTNFILASFASFFAERHYIKNDLNTTSKLMNLVIGWKQWRMNKKEWKLWIAANMLPVSIIRALKRFKN